MRKKSFILTVSYMAAALAVVSGFAIGSFLRVQKLERSGNAAYSRAFSSLVSSVEDIDSSLRKCLYATSAQTKAALCTNIFGKAQAAQASLGELPFSGLLLERTAGFLGSVGDYGFMLSREAAAGGEMSEDEFQNLVSLADAADVLSGCLTDLQTRVGAGEVTFLALSENGAEGAGEITSLGENFSVIETDFPEIPSLIYDGPFSQHIRERSPRLIEGLAEISAEDALRFARDFTESASLTLRCERGGNLPAYCFSDGETNVEITRAGGRLLSISSSADVSGASIITPEDAVKTAREYLDKHGFESMKESYWQKSGGSVLVNFAYVQNGVICYPDLIKVAVSLSTGEVTGFEALGYVMNHALRELPETAVSEQDAAARVPDSLKVLSHSLAIIPTDGKYEKFCHEFKCETAEGTHFIIYVNAETGEQEKILMLIEDENGTLSL